MKLFKGLIAFLTTVSLYSQPAYNEQILSASGGSTVVTNGQWAVVGDEINNKVHIYPMDYSTFLWSTANKVELTAPKIGGFGTSVAIDDDLIVVGAPDVETWRMEAGQITIDATFNNPNFTTINLQRTYEEPPLIFALASDQGSDPSAVRIKNRTLNSFEIIHAEPNNKDGSHVEMSVFYLAIERGDHVLPNGTRILAEEYNTTHVRYDTNRFSSGDTVAYDGITFSKPFSAQPMVLGQIQTMENEQGTVPTSASSPWLTTAVRNVTNNGFEIALERSEVIDSNDVTVPETIAYLVMDVSTGSFSDVSNNTINFESIYSTDVFTGWGTCVTVPFTQTFSSAPLVVATKNTVDGADGGWLRRCSLTAGVLGLTVDEDTYTDDERNHTNERAGILAFSQNFSATFKGGEAYLYGWNSTSGWQFKEQIEPTVWSDDMKFGTAVGIHTNNDGTAEIVVGAPEVTNVGGDTGKVFAYSWSGTSSAVNSVLTGTSIHSRRFGSALDINDNYLIVGASDEQTPATNDFVGASYTFEHNGIAWSEYPNTSNSRIKRGTSNEKLGTHVAINSDGNVSMIAGSETANSNSYLYTLNATVWSSSYSTGLRDGGDVDTDDDVYMMAQRAGHVHFNVQTESDSPVLSLVPILTPEMTAVSLYKEQAVVNNPSNNQAIAIDVPCGIKPTHLVANEWAIVSVPCGDGTATIDNLFGDDMGSGTDVYCQTEDPNEVCNWTMYKDGPNYTGKSSESVHLADNEAMALGQGYWIIADHDVTLKADANVITSRTALNTSSSSIDIAGHYEFNLPNITTTDPVKVMIGNPFPRTINWANVTEENGNPLGTIVDATAYVYDSSSTSGQPYSAITGIPGFPNVVEAYQAVWIIKLIPDTGAVTRIDLPFEK